MRFVFNSGTVNGLTLLLLVMISSAFLKTHARCYVASFHSFNPFAIDAGVGSCSAKLLLQVVYPRVGQCAHFRQTRNFIPGIQAYRNLVPEK